MIWLKDEKEEKVSFYTIKGNIQELKKIKKSIEEARILYMCSYNIINSILAHEKDYREKANISLGGLLPLTTVYDTLKFIDNLDKGQTKILLDRFCPDLLCFSTEILDAITLVQKREFFINSLNEMKRLADEVGINDLGPEYREALKNVELARHNSEMLTLSKKIKEKLN